MNRENLQKAADYIRTIPQEMFNMDRMRDWGDDFTHECKTVGCVIGHSVAIFPWDQIPKFRDGSIIYSEFSIAFFQLNPAKDVAAWAWCFGPNWSVIDNTPKGAALRIEWLIKNGLPKNHFDQYMGSAPLCYYEGGKP